MLSDNPDNDKIVIKLFNGRIIGESLYKDNPIVDITYFRSTAYPEFELLMGVSVYPSKEELEEVTITYSTGPFQYITETIPRDRIVFDRGDGHVYSI